MAIKLPPPPREKVSELQSQQWLETLWNFLKDNFTERESYTATMGLTGGATTVTAYWWRVMDMLHVEFDALFSTVFTGGSATLTIPTGLTIDTDKIPGTKTPGFSTRVGRAGFHDVGSDHYEGSIFYYSTTEVLAKVTVDDAGTGSNYLAAANSISTTAPFTWANNDRMHGYFSVPILEWGT